MNSRIPDPKTWGMRRRMIVRCLDALKTETDADKRHLWLNAIEFLLDELAHGECLDALEQLTFTEVAVLQAVGYSEISLRNDETLAKLATVANERNGLKLTAKETASATVRLREAGLLAFPNQWMYPTWLTSDMLRMVGL